MAFTITCPSCTAKLKTAAAIPMGRSVQCPKCKSSFKVNEDNIAETRDSKAEIPSTASRSSATRPAAAPARRAPAPPAGDAANPFSFDSPSKNGRRDDEDDDRPRSRKRDDNEEDRPRSRRRDEDEDDRPRKRRDEDEDDRPRSRRRDDDEEDDRPKKRRRDEEDEDDRPRSLKRVDDDDDRPSRHRDDDDEDDDRPRRPKKKKKRKKGSAAILIISIVSLLLLVGGGLLLYFLVFAGGYDSEMVALMPADVQSLDFESIESVADNAKFKKIVEKEFGNDSKYALVRSAGLTVNDVRSSLVGRTEKGVAITVVRLKNSADKGKFTTGGTESKAGDKPYWKVKKDGADTYVAFPSDSLVLQVSKEDTIKGILNKEDGKVVISEQLQELAKKVGDGNQWHAYASKREGKMPDVGGDDVMKARMNSKGSAMRINISSSSLEFTSYTLCASSEDANKIVEHDKKKREEMKGKIDEAFEKGQGKGKFNEAQREAFKKMITGASISASGSYVESSGTLDLTPFDNLDDADAGFLPFLF